MKKIATLILCVMMLCLLSGCKSKVPEVIKNPNTQFVEVEAYK